ncbi:hypothetical protein R3P38DRAFT_3592561 [Favolaschia claudopus]|uniref:Uncharacterized protein n=1 Tax=Favolaschia claudopus TaxID=2862362 RepID=A0AAW0AH27_9AGAR
MKGLEAAARSDMNDDRLGRRPPLTALGGDIIGVSPYDSEAYTDVLFTLEEDDEITEKTDEKVIKLMDLEILSLEILLPSSYSSELVLDLGYTKAAMLLFFYLITPALVSLDLRESFLHGETEEVSEKHAFACNGLNWITALWSLETSCNRLAGWIISRFKLFKSFVTCLGPSRAKVLQAQPEPTLKHYGTMTTTPHKGAAERQTQPPPFSLPTTIPAEEQAVEKVVLVPENQDASGVAFQHVDVSGVVIERLNLPRGTRSYKCSFKPLFLFGLEATAWIGRLHNPKTMRHKPRSAYDLVVAWDPAQAATSKTRFFRQERIDAMKVFIYRSGCALQQLRVVVEEGEAETAEPEGSLKAKAARYKEAFPTIPDIEVDVPEWL